MKQPVDGLVNTLARRGAAFSGGGGGAKRSLCDAEIRRPEKTSRERKGGHRPTVPRGSRYFFLSRPAPSECTCYASVSAQRATFPFRPKGNALRRRGPGDSGVAARSIPPTDRGRRWWSTSGAARGVPPGVCFIGSVVWPRPHGHGGCWCGGGGRSLGARGGGAKGLRPNLRLRLMAADSTLAEPH